MSENQEAKKNSKGILVAIVVVIVVIGVGVFLYQKGQSDMRSKVQMEQLREQMENERKQKIAEIKDAIPYKKAELQMAYDKLEDVNSFHLLRTSSEKMEQLAAQNRVIDELKEELDRLEQELSILQSQTY